MGSTSKPPSSPGEKQLYFLATKVVAPRCQGLIERPRLLDVTSQLSGKQLAVLKAPAGFGKTSLAATWSERIRQSGHIVAWLTIDPDDDEPATFLFYVSQIIYQSRYDCTWIDQETLLDQVNRGRADPAARPL